MNSQLYDYQNNVIASASRQPLAELSLTQAKQFYLSISLVPQQGLSFEVGSGDGVDRTSIPLVSGIDGNYPYTLENLTRIGFSANSQYDIVYTNVKPCTASLVATSAPSAPAVGGGGGLPPATLSINRPKRNHFFLWPDGWTKPSLANDSCFSFRYPLSKAGKIFIALADQPMGNVKFNTVLAGSHAHVLAVTRNTVQLYRDGIVIDSQYIVPAIALPHKGSTPIVMKVVSNSSGTVNLYSHTIAETGNWTLLYQYTDSSAGFVGTRYSLASSIIRNFSQIALCDV